MNVQELMVFDCVNYLLGSDDSNKNLGAYLENSVMERLMCEKPKVLLVEDDETCRLFGTIALKKKGFTVITANDGQEAIRMANTEAYDLIFMDINLPLIDGYSATEAIRKNEKNHTPIIAMTALTQAADQERCITVGMDDFIGQPVDIHALYKMVDKWLK